MAPSGKVLTVWKVLTVLHVTLVLKAFCFTLEGSDRSYVRFPKWYHAFDNVLRFEFKTKRPNSLLLYTDDGGKSNFYELRLVNGELHLQFRLGKHLRYSTLHWISLGKDLDNDKWHKVQLFQLWDKVKLHLDDETHVKRLNQEDFSFGSYSSNGDIFIGGLPHDTRPDRLSHPLALKAPHFEGTVRNLVYRVFPHGVTAPHAVDSQGLRSTETNYCTASFCQNGGYCYSSDAGPKCECEHTDYQGKLCEAKAPSTEAAFTGTEYLSYDFTKNGNGFVSSEEEISFHFKTVRQTALLFFSGNHRDYFHVGLKEGEIIARSSLGGSQLKVYSGAVAISDKTPPRFNDNKWHKVVVHRKLTQLSLNVDSSYTDIDQSMGSAQQLSSTLAYLAGKPVDQFLPLGLEVNGFVGCLRNVRYHAEGRQLDFLRSAELGVDGLVTANKNISFQCLPEVTSVEAVSFGGTNAGSYLILPKWAGTDEGFSSLKFKLRTNEPYGLIMYNGNLKPNATDFFAFEMVAGYLYFLINLGSGTLRLQVSEFPLNDKRWHLVSLERQGQVGVVNVDLRSVPFQVPGTSNKLDLDESLLVGGINWRDPRALLDISPTVWTASLRTPYIGCLTNVVLNGFPVELTLLLHQPNAADVTVGCYESLPECPSAPCKNEGRCIEGWNRYTCECTQGSFSGSNCEDDQMVVDFNGDHHVHAALVHMQRSQAEDLEINFKPTRRSVGLLFGTSVNGASDIMQVWYSGEAIELHINLGQGTKVFQFGKELQLNVWHIAKIRRRSHVLQMGIDNGEVVQGELSADHVILQYDSFWVGQLPLPSLVTRGRFQNADGFFGRISSVIFNKQSVFHLAAVQKTAKPTAEYVPNPSVGAMPPSNSILLPVTFTSRNAYAKLIRTFPSNVFSVSFRFRTLEPTALLLYITAANKHRPPPHDFFAIELVQGKIHYAFNLGNGPRVLKASNSDPLNDLLWHTVRVSKPNNNEQYLIVDGSVITRYQIDGPNRDLNVDGPLYIGGVAQQNYSGLPASVQAIHGVRGCMASIEINGAQLHVLNDASEINDVVAGCEEPKTKCTDESCANGGLCLQQWSTFTCDCSMTSRSGPTCETESISYVFGPAPGSIQFRYDTKEHPSTTGDTLALGITTNQTDSILMRVDSGSSLDYMLIEVLDGYLFVVYNLGDQDHRIGEVRRKVSDGQYHTLRFIRTGRNSTLQIDDLDQNHYYPAEQKLQVFNYQATIVIGGQPNPSTLSKNRNRKPRDRSSTTPEPLLGRPFKGKLSGIMYNSLRLLDLAQAKDPRIRIVGEVKLQHQGDVEKLPKDNGLVPRQTYFNMNDRMSSTEPSFGQDDIIVSGDFEGSGAGCQNDEADDIACQPESPSPTDLITPYVRVTRPLATTRSTTAISTTPIATSPKRVRTRTSTSTTSTTTTMLITTTTTTAATAAPPSTSTLTSSTASDTPATSTALIILPETTLTAIPTTSDSVQIDLPDTEASVPSDETENEDFFPILTDAVTQPRLTTTTRGLLTTGPPPPETSGRTTLIAVVSVILLVVLIVIIFIVYKCRRKGEYVGVDESREYKQVPTEPNGHANGSQGGAPLGNGGNFAGLVPSYQGNLHGCYAKVEWSGDSAKTKRDVKEWYV